MTALYVLTSQYMQLAQTLADGDFDLATIHDTIEASGIEDEIATKAQSLEFIAREAEKYGPMIDMEIERLQALKASRAKVAQGLRDYLKSNMERAGIEKIECPLFKLSIKHNQPAVEIMDTSSIPAEYWRTPEPKPPAPAPDKTAIKKALQSGVDVMGARLVHGTRLEVK